MRLGLPAGEALSVALALALLSSAPALGQETDTGAALTNGDRHDSAADAQPSVEGDVEGLQRAVDAGVAEALVPLGMAYFLGDGVEADRGRAVSLILAAIEADVPGAGGALLAVGYGVRSGSNGPADPAAALDIFGRALDEGVSEAAVPLGWAYGTGEGVAREPARAAQYLQLASEQGVPGATELLEELDLP